MIGKEHADALEKRLGPRRAAHGVGRLAEPAAHFRKSGTSSSSSSSKTTDLRRVLGPSPDPEPIRSAPPWTAPSAGRGGGTDSVAEAGGSCGSAAFVPFPPAEAVTAGATGPAAPPWSSSCHARPACTGLSLSPGSVTGRHGAPNASDPCDGW